MCCGGYKMKKAQGLPLKDSQVLGWGWGNKSNQPEHSEKWQAKLKKKHVKGAQKGAFYLNING